jgi:hypothetical protein
MRGLLILATLTLAGCGFAKVNGDYQASTAQYKACVAAKGPSDCETERVIMETDERRMDTMMGNTDKLTVMRR